MKKILLILVALIGFGIMVNAQDIITLKNGTDINAFVQKIGDVEIEYKKFDNPNGPNYTLKKTEILMIRYENGTKDIFSEETKPIEVPQAPVSESTSVKNNENIETVLLPDNTQSRADVIVGLFQHGGFQTKITGIDSKYIHYIKFKRNGKQLDKKIKQKKVAYTLTFNESAKQEMYPVRMSVQEFQSLPIYFIKGTHAWTVFGTYGMSNLTHIKKIHPEIYEDFVKGQKLLRTSSALSIPACIPFLFPFLVVPGMITMGNGYSKINNSVAQYYANCVKLEILDKYGIIITPYRVNPLTMQPR